MQEAIDETIYQWMLKTTENGYDVWILGNGSEWYGFTTKGETRIEAPIVYISKWVLRTNGTIERDHTLRDRGGHPMGWVSAETARGMWCDFVRSGGVCVASLRGKKQNETA